MSNIPIARISVRRKEGETYRSYSVLTAWSTRFDGLINITLDKGSEKYPAMGLLDAIKAVAAGASIEIRTSTGQRSPASRSGGNYDRPSSGGDYGGGYDDGVDVPF